MTKLQTLLNRLKSDLTDAYNQRQQAITQMNVADARILMTRSFIDDLESAIKNEAQKG